MRKLTQKRLAEAAVIVCAAVLFLCAFFQECVCFFLTVGNILKDFIW